MRLKLTVAYDGTAYEGWQIQQAPRQPRTIQGMVEAAFYTLTSCQCRVTGAGRTDAGTHAFGQIAHVDVPPRSWCWRERLNMTLPPDIRIIEAVPVDSDFHARKDALDKTYIYHFWQEKAFVPPHLRNYVWMSGPLDVQLMREACVQFLGEHDFASFQNSGTPQKSTVRNILEIDLTETAGLEYFPRCLPMLNLQIRATGFLKQMVRNIAGFLADVGRAKIQPAEVPGILASQDRRCVLSATAPARGLFLAHISYAQPL